MIVVNQIQQALVALTKNDFLILTSPYVFL